jgi:predicted RNase H-like HicB family nuclease
LCQLLESLGFDKRVSGSRHLFRKSGVEEMIKYEVIIYWSDEDGVFIAEAPELPGCMAHGPTQESALGNALDAVHLWIDSQGVRRSDSGTERTPLNPSLRSA